MAVKDEEKWVRSLIEKERPEFLQEYDVFLRSAEDLPKIDDTLIANWQQIAYLEYQKFMRTPASLSSFFIAVWEIAKSFKEKKMLAELREIYGGGMAIRLNKKFVLPIIDAEAIAFTEVYMPSTKRYFLSNWKNPEDKELWKPSEIKSYVYLCRQRIADIFNEILRTHSFNVVSMETHYTTETAKDTGMPTMQAMQ